MNLGRLSRMGLKNRIGFFSNFPVLRTSIVKVLSSVQTEKLPEVQLLAITASHALLCEELGLDPHEILAQSRRMLHDASGPFCEQILAMRQYIRNELRK